MVRERAKRYSFGARAVSALLIALLCTALLSARAESEQTVRVAFIDQNALSYLDEDGNRAGYDYEYLQEIAQYTGWNYEFVDFAGDNEGISAAMEQLKSGEIDLMTSLIYYDSLAEDCDYAAYENGMAYTVLGTFKDSATVNESNLFQQENLRVAVPEKANARIEELNEFCARHEIVPELVRCADREAQRQAIRDGRADVVLEVDLNLPGDMYAVTRFAGRPFYFTTTKGNVALLNKLNAALLNINQIDPYFSVELYKKYFGNGPTALSLTAEEQAYVRGAGVVRVAVFPDRMPVQDIDEVTGEVAGLAKDVLDYVAETTGLQVQYVPIRSLEELAGLLADGKIDMVAGMPYDYATAERYNVVLSRPYMTAPTAYGTANAQEVADLRGERLAIPMGGVYDHTLTDNVQWYETVQACLEAVERDEADFAVGDGYTMRYYVNAGNYRDVALVVSNSSTERVCIGLSKPINVNLLTVLNKTVRSLSEDKLQAMLFRNIATPVRVTFASFVQANPLGVLGSISAVALLIIGLLLIYFRAHVRNSRREALENERYKQLGEISNEHLFEYDHVQDVITLSEKSAKTLGVPREVKNYLCHLQQDNSLNAEKEREFLSQVLEEKNATGELQVAMPEGQRWFRITAKLIADENGKPIITVGRMTDIQKEREELECLSEKARRDSLTGIYNGETVRQTVSRRLTEYPGSGALLVLDVDEFKGINDRNGHFIGDKVLIALAQMLEDAFRRSDVVGRLGGDEFVVFMDRVVDRVIVEEKCRQVLSGAIKLELPQDVQNVTVSIGVAMVKENMNYDDLYQAGDKALYMAKNNGRNGYEII